MTEVLPRPLKDPLRVIRLFYVGYILLQLTFLVILFVLLYYSCRVPFSARLHGLLFLLMLPLLLCFVSILPKRRVNAFYLRSFQNDSRTWPVRQAAQEALGPAFRLSGIRDPRRRSSPILRYLTTAIFAFRYASPRYMNLEAGADWEIRLWRSLGDARCALIDVTDLTPFVVEEILLCSRYLGLDRVIFLGDSSRHAAEWQDIVAQTMGSMQVEADGISVAIWDDTPNGRLEFRRAIESYVSRLPPGTPGLDLTARPQAETAANPGEGEPAWEGEATTELAWGISLTTLLVGGLSGVYQGLKQTDWLSAWWLIGVGFALAEAWLFIECVFQIGSNCRKVVILSSTVLATCWFVGGMNWMISEARASSQHAININNLKQIGLAFHEFEDRFEVLPSSGAFPDSGSGRSAAPAVSWRVRILPLIDEDALFYAYRLDEPWDSENNLRLLSKMPTVYALPGEKSRVTPTPVGFTYYRVFVNSQRNQPDRPRAIFDAGPAPVAPNHTNLGTKEVRLSDITDGPGKTILVAEASEAVPWTKPDELIFDPDLPIQPLGGNIPGGFVVGFADGSVGRLEQGVDDEFLRAMITRNGAENLDNLAKKGKGWSLNSFLRWISWKFVS